MSIKKVLGLAESFLKNKGAHPSKGYTIRQMPDGTYSWLFRSSYVNSGETLRMRIQVDSEGNCRDPEIISRGDKKRLGRKSSVADPAVFMAREPSDRIEVRGKVVEVFKKISHVKTP